MLSSGDYPPAADLRATVAKHPLPFIEPGTVNPGAMTADAATKHALAAVSALNSALAADDAGALERCFFPGQAYWRDTLALTWHLRTFTSPGVVAASLLQTKALRGLEGEMKLEGQAQFVPVSPVLQFIDCSLVFKTSSPAANCHGRMCLLPVKSGDAVRWKIWILSTWVESLSVHPEGENLLRSPGRDLDGSEPLDTDVFIIGGGNSALTLAARLKAMGVDSVMVDRNARPGDNWALRYDYLKFHVPTSLCEMPYLCYEKHLQTPHLLSRDDLAEQVRRYAAALNLNLITSATIQSTTFDRSTKRWLVGFQTPRGQRTATAKHLVQATGVASQKPYLPPMADEGLYSGISIHSTAYKNATSLKEKGVKSVLIIGSANTAFDVLQDCHAAGLQATIVARSPTYLLPLEHLYDPRGLGVYDHSVAAADRLFMTGPMLVDAQLASGLLALLASQEPDRYKPVAAAGFPVLTSCDPGVSLLHNLFERGGGHYVDIGGTKLIAEGKVGVKAGVEPVGYTATGLRFSDGSTADADAVVWCTGFADKNVRDTAAEILGGGLSNGDHRENGGDVLGPSEIAARLDATWGVDAEGEIRGMWKRQLAIDNYWIMGGPTHYQRWHSRTLALQIKAALEGILPPAYRDTPEPGITGG